MNRKQHRTTHSDLAAIIRAHAKSLQKVPAGYCVSDAAILNCLEAAAAALVDQDNRIGELTVKLREATYGK